MVVGNFRLALAISRHEQVPQESMNIHIVLDSKDIVPCESAIHQVSGAAIFAVNLFCSLSGRNSTDKDLEN